MSKHKTNNKLSVTRCTLSDNQTICEQFDEYLQKHGRKVSKIIGFLALQNARIISKLHSDNIDDAPEKLKEELVDFYEMFMDIYDDVTYEARIANWGDEPLVLSLGEYYQEQMLYEKQKQELQALSDDIKQEAKSLADKIWNIRATRDIAFVLNVSENGLPEHLHIGKTIPRQHLDMVYTFLLYDCAAMIMAGGAMTVRVTKQHVTEIFGAYADLEGSWLPVTAEEMLNAHTLCSDGSRLEPEDGVVYTEITK